MNVHIKLPVGYFPPENFTLMGRKVGQKNVYWCERLKPRDMLRVEWVEGMAPPDDFQAYFQQCLDKRKSQ